MSISVPAGPPIRYLIRSLDELDFCGFKLYWSDANGWGGAAGADWYSIPQREELRLPDRAEWVPDWGSVA